MNVNKMLLGALAGGIVYFFLGWLVWGMLLGSTMEMPPEIKSVVAKDPMVMWAMVVSCLVFGLLLAYIFERWAGISTFVSGAKAGAVIGGLSATSLDLSLFSMHNLMDITQVVADVAASTVVSPIVGGIIGLVLGSGKKQ